MDVRITPPLGESEQRALILALERAGIRAPGPPAAYESAWRSAGIAEATESGDGVDDYTLSPRSTRGATRA